MRLLSHRSRLLDLALFGETRFFDVPFLLAIMTDSVTVFTRRCLVFPGTSEACARARQKFLIRGGA